MKKTAAILSIWLIFLIFFVSQPSIAENLVIRGGESSNSFNWVSNASGSQQTVASTVYKATTVGVTYFTYPQKYFDFSYSNGMGSLNNTHSFNSSEWSLISGTNSDTNYDGRTGNFYWGLKGWSSSIADPSLVTTYPLGGVAIVVGGGWLWTNNSWGAYGVNLGCGYVFGNGNSSSSSSSGSSSNNSDTLVAFSVGATYVYPFTPKYGVNLDWKYNYIDYSISDPRNLPATYKNGLTVTQSPYSMSVTNSTIGLSGYYRF